MTRRFLSLFIQACVLAICAIGAWFILSGNGSFFGGSSDADVQAEEERVIPVQRPVVVTTVQPEIVDLTPEIAALGQLEAWDQSEILSEVAGRVVWVNPDFELGLTVEADDVLLRVDDLEYRRNVLAAEMSIAVAKDNLDDLETDAELRRRDFERGRSGEEPNARVLRTLERQAAKFEVQAAELELELAHEAVANTKIKAPFTGILTSRNVNLGDVISGGTALGEIIGTNRARVRLPVLDSHLAHFSAGQPVRLEPLSGGEAREGVVVSVEPMLDATTLLNSVVVQVPSPLAHPPLRLGSFLRGLTSGEEIKDVMALPLSALVGEGEFFEVTEDRSLRRRSASEVYRDHEYAYIPAEPGLKIVSQDVLGLRDGLVVTEVGQ